MNAKIVAGGVVAILVIAGVIGAVAIVNDKDKGNADNEAVLHDTWYLRYTERASFVDDDGNPLTDADDCTIESQYVDPKSGKMKIQLTDIREDIFQGKIGDMKVSGRYDANAIWITATTGSDPDHVYISQGVYDKDRLALSSFMCHKDGTLCAAIYALYIHDVNSTVSPMEDMVNYNMTYEHVYSKFHSNTDFAPGGDSRGMDSDIHHMYARSHSLISLFDVLDGNGDPIGIQAVVSLGTTPTGNAIGKIATYDIIDGKVNSLIGDVCMSAGKMNIVQFMVSPMENSHFVESEYNVPYKGGSVLSPAVLSGKYAGTVTSYYTDGNSSTNRITKDFSQDNKTIYAVEDTGTIEYIWFGSVMTSHFFIVEVKIMHKDGHLVGGILNGVISPDGKVKLVGVIHEKGSFEEVAVIYELTPVK